MAAGDLRIMRKKIAVFSALILAACVIMAGCAATFTETPVVPGILPTSDNTGAVGVNGTAYNVGFFDRLFVRGVEVGDNLTAINEALAAGSTFERASCFVYFTATATYINNETYTHLYWTAEYYDDRDMHDANDDKIFVPDDGLYLAVFQGIMIDSPASGGANRLYLNFMNPDDSSISLYQCEGEALIGTTWTGTVTSYEYLEAGDYIYGGVYQNCGGQKNLYGGYSYRTSLKVEKVF